MLKVLPFFTSGLLLGVIFVELTYRLAGRGLIGFYLLSLPAKLFLWAFAFLTCHLMGGLSGILSCVPGFLLGFLFMLFFRGFKKNGRAESS